MECQSENKKDGRRISFLPLNKCYVFLIKHNRTHAGVNLFYFYKTVFGLLPV